MKSEEIEHEYTDETVCPWCGYEHGDSWEQPDEGEMECQGCNKAFTFERYVEVTYITKKKD